MERVIAGRNQRATDSAGQDRTVKLAVNFCCRLTPMTMLHTELTQSQTNIHSVLLTKTNTTPCEVASETSKQHLHVQLLLSVALIERTWTTSTSQTFGLTVG